MLTTASDPVLAKEELVLEEQREGTGRAMAEGGLGRLL